ncbi:hypothetical protein AD006_12340 [Pseudonocardia sp. EC080610-09]|uniref:hypothetical protein n=1 Tax=unclassified Pseudonocardia TaxID=2619320 RepID=UPI000705704E|nr:MULTISPECIES: hypothetical protein [unclassified Pseudonocardia]ALL75895.1 hypothetical protein AD006_12340 [Pseudonocardia sp. EC080610-09]ALL82922.1 hypothetical protein AD017_20170 [Pseudonocardia sp. EC080619-01]
MELTTETLVSPYSLELARDDQGRIKAVTVTAVGDSELTLSQLEQAWRALRDRLRSDELRGRGTYNRRRGVDVLTALSKAWDGQITDEYLAALAIAYEEVSKLPGRAMLDSLAEAVGRPQATVRAHVSRARREGWLVDRDEQGAQRGNRHAPSP